MMVGLILKTSFVLLRFSLLSKDVTCFVVVCASVKAGGKFMCSIFCCMSCGMGGIVWLVLCPIVMKWSFSASAISFGS